MNYGQLRDILTCTNTPILEKALIPSMVVNLCDEVQKIALSLYLEANLSCVYKTSYHKDKKELLPIAREKFEKLIELLPKELTFCHCFQELDNNKPIGTGI